MNKPFYQFNSKQHICIYCKQSFRGPVRQQRCDAPECVAAMAEAQRLRHIEQAKAQRVRLKAARRKK